MSGISELADRAMKEARQNKQEAKTVVHALLDQYPDVKARFLESVVDTAIANEISLAAHRSRTPSKAQPLDATGTDPAVLRVSFTYADSVLDSWAMACNKPLGDSVLDDLKSESGAERNRAQGHIFKANFYDALAKGMKGKPNATVRECWTDIRVRTLLKSLGG